MVIRFAISRENVIREAISFKRHHAAVLFL